MYIVFINSATGLMTIQSLLKMLYNCQIQWHPYSNVYRKCYCQRHGQIQTWLRLRYGYLHSSRNCNV
jgi:hypothetical protein